MRDINQELAKLKYSAHTGVGFGVIASSKGADFSPTDISNLHAWYDASDLSTITKDGSDRVSQWDDLSGNGFHLTQATGGSQPLWVDNDRNGEDVIDFAGDRFMQVAWTTLSQPNTVVGVFVIPDINSGTNRYAFDGESTQSGLYARDNLDLLTLRAGTDLEGTGVTELVWANFFGLFNGASSSYDIDGSNVASGDAGTAGLDGFTVMAFNAESNFGNQKVGEIIVYDKEVSGSEKTNLMSYLQDKWGF